MSAVGDRVWQVFTAVSLIICGPFQLANPTDSPPRGRKWYTFVILILSAQRERAAAYPCLHTCSLDMHGVTPDEWQQQFIVG